MSLSVVSSCRGGTHNANLRKNSRCVGIYWRDGNWNDRPGDGGGNLNGSGIHIHVGHHRHYYDSYAGGGWNTWNGCPPGYTIQGGNCAPRFTAITAK